MREAVFVDSGPQTNVELMLEAGRSRPGAKSGETKTVAQSCVCLQLARPEGSAAKQKRGRTDGGVTAIVRPRFGESPVVQKPVRPKKGSGNVLLSHKESLAVPLALEGLTAVFGMGTGVTPPPWSPG